MDEKTKRRYEIEQRTIQFVLVYEGGDFWNPANEHLSVNDQQGNVLFEVVPHGDKFGWTAPLQARDEPLKSNRSSGTVKEAKADAMKELMKREGELGYMLSSPPKVDKPGRVTP